jgi:hypothetical protein
MASRVVSDDVPLLDPMLGSDLFDSVGERFQLLQAVTRSRSLPQAGQIYG